MRNRKPGRLRGALLAAALAAGCAAPGADERPGMTQAQLEALIAEHGSEVEGEPGVVEFVYDGVRMACVSDTTHDRMRILAPVARESDVSAAQRARVMVANFHTALDARYASSEDILYAVYLHPLASLDEGQLLSALSQVASLVRTFGTSYTSGTLSYGEPDAAGGFEGVE